MAQGPSDTNLVAIRITLRIWESKVRNPDRPDRRRFVLSEHSFLVFYVFNLSPLTVCVNCSFTVLLPVSSRQVERFLPFWQQVERN